MSPKPLLVLGLLLLGACAEPAMGPSGPSSARTVRPGSSTNHQSCGEPRGEETPLQPALARATTCD